VTGPKTGFLIEGEDRTGVMADVYGKLAAARINVTASDAVVAGAGRFGAILWVKAKDVTRTARVLGAS
jgi:predicted amino acid-binding ACT domain protein